MQTFVQQSRLLLSLSPEDPNRKHFLGVVTQSQGDMVFLSLGTADGYNGWLSFRCIIIFYEENEMIRIAASANRITEELRLMDGRINRQEVVPKDRGLLDKGQERGKSFPVQQEHHELEDHFLSVLFETANLDSLDDLLNPSREDVVLTVKSIVDRLNAFQREWGAFLRKLVRIDVERLRPDSTFDDYVRSALAQYVDDVIMTEGGSPYRVSSPLIPAVLCLDSEAMRSESHKKLHDAIFRMAKHMVGNLDHLLKHWVCGLIVRHPNATCEYTYGYRKIEMKVNQSTSRFMYRNLDPNDPFFGKNASVNEHVISSNSKITNVLCSHYLMHVIEVEPGKGYVHVPTFHQRVIDSVPSWLRSQVRLVEGTLVGGYVVEQDMETYEHKGDPTVEIFYHGDPAVVLGQYVLTGWGPSEIADDLSKKNAQSLKDNREEKKPTLFDRLHKTVYGYFKP